MGRPRGGPRGRASGGVGAPSGARAAAHRKVAAFCENGAKAVTWEATPVLVPSSFWAEHSIDDLLDKSEYWLGMQGRLTTPVHKPAGSDHYEEVGWQRAFEIIAAKLNSLASPDEASFYTSGRTSNEAAFVYQLFVRAFGTNNLPDCSNMCHESTGTAMSEVVGIGKSTIAYDDFEKADLIILMGQNPGTNHLDHVERPEGRLLLQTLRSHDQYNTTIYSLNDRYRGIKKGREVHFINPDDLADLGLVDGRRVDIVTDWPDDIERALRGYRAVAYPTARGCAAAYFPEANVLVPLDSAALGSNTPVSKAVLVSVVASPATAAQP